MLNLEKGEIQKRSSLCKKVKMKIDENVRPIGKNMFKCFLFVNFTQICIHGEKMRKL